MNEQELLNEPVMCSLGGEDVPFRTLSVAKRGAIAEAYFLERYIREIKLKAKAFDGKEEQKAYISKKLEEAPSGDDLGKAIESLGFSDALVIRFMAETCADDKMTANKLERLCAEADDVELRTVFKVMIGKKNLTQPRANGGRSARGSRKSTAGRSTTSGRSRKRKS